MILTVNTENDTMTGRLDACIKAVNALGMDHSEFSWGKENRLLVNGKLKQFQLSNFMSDFTDGGSFQANGFTNAMK